MSFEPIINEVLSKHRRKLGAQQCYAEIKGETLAGEEIVSVLSVSSTPSVVAVNATPSGADAIISIRSAMLAVTTANEIVCISAQAECVCKLTVSGLDAECKVFVFPNIVETNNIKVSGGQVSCTILLENNFWTVSNESIKFVSSVSDNAFTKLATIKYSDVVSATTECFEHIAEVDIPTSVSRVLCAESVVQVLGLECGNDMLTLNGQVISNVIYLTSDEIPRLKSQTYTNDFRQEILAGGCSQAADAVPEIYVSSTEFEIQGELNSGKGLLSVKTKICTQVIASEVKEVECVADAYCTDNHLSLTAESYNVYSVVCAHKLSDKVDGNIVLDENAARIEKVFCNAASFAVITSVEAGQDVVLAEGVVYANILYLSDTEAGVVSSIQTEIPFASKLTLEGITADSEIDLFAHVVEVDSRIKKGREIDVQAEVLFSVRACKSAPNAVVSNITLGEAKAANEAPLGVYMLSNCPELWDAAKQLSVCPESLLAQNPGLNFPINEPQNIVVYRQKKI